MTWYNTGTVTVTPGSNAVIGIGTAFIRNARVGDGFRGPDGGWYEITNIASDTALSISPHYGAPSAYAVAPLQGYVKDSADALREATRTIAGGIADMQDQVAAATEAAESAGHSKATATEQASIATDAAALSTDHKNASQQAAEKSQSSAGASDAAAVRAESARDSIVQSEQAAADSAEAAAASAQHAEEVTIGKAASGDNNDITSLRALTADGFDRIRQGLAPMVGATATAAGTKGLVPIPTVADRLKVLSGAGTWVPLPASSWGTITGSLSDQIDLKAALDAKQSISTAPFTKFYQSPNTAWAASGLIEFTHNLGQPKMVQVYAVLTAATGNYPIGTIFSLCVWINANYWGAMVVAETTTVVRVRMASALGLLVSAGSAETISPSNSQIFVRVAA